MSQEIKTITMNRNWDGVIIFYEGDTPPRCGICNANFMGLRDGLEWTIVNGIAMCRCTAEYNCFNRDKAGNIRPMEPTCCVPKELIPLYKEAWEISKGDREKFHKLVKKINKEHPDED